MEPVVETREGISLRARLFVLFMKIAVRPFLRHGPFHPAMLRFMGVLDWLGCLLIAPLGTKVERVRFDGFKAEWVRGKGSAGSDRVILYFHGGGFMSCGLRTHRRLIARISAASGVPALSIAYRQIPRTNLAGSVADCVTAYRHLLDHGHTADQIIVSGDSAGGFLSFAAPLKAIDEGLPAPGSIVALSPLTDLDDAVKLEHENLMLDAYIPGMRFDIISKHLLKDMVPDPLHSPVNGDLAKLPPVLIHVGSTEILRHDAQLMTDRLAAAGVPATLTIWEGQPHVFQVFADLCPEGHTAIAEIGAFIRAVPAVKELPEVA